MFVLGSVDDLLELGFKRFTTERNESFKQFQYCDYYENVSFIVQTAPHFDAL